METLDTIFARASYRGQYEAAPVPREELALIMAAGLAAPSGCNQQTTSLIAVDDPTLLHKLRGAIGHSVGQTAPAMICVLTRRINTYHGMCFSTQDYSATVQNMLLAIVALGYQSCWVEGYITSDDHTSREMAALLAVPDDYELVCCLPVGRAKETVKRVTKEPFEQRAWFNGFQKA